MEKTSDFRQKEVINVRDGRRLGVIIDMEFDLKTGRITDCGSGTIPVVGVY